MNKAWRSLMIIAVLGFLAIIGWEIYQIFDGTRADFNVVVVDMPRQRIFDDATRDFLLR